MRLRTGTVAIGLAISLAAGPARSESVEFELPFLGDGPTHAVGVDPGVPWPGLRRGVAGAVEPTDGPASADAAPQGGPPAPASFPDVSELLGPLGASVLRGRVSCADSADRPRIERLLAAVAAGCDRRVTVTVRADGIEHSLSARPGALVVDDRMRLATFPGGTEGSSVHTAPFPVQVHDGVRIAWTASPCGAGRIVLDLDLVEHRVEGERVLDDPRVRAVAPLVRVRRLRGTFALRDGVETALGPGPAPVVTARLDGPDAPQGTRVLHVPAWGSCLPVPQSIEPGLIEWPWEEDESEDLDEEVRLPLPAAWTAAAREAGVRLVAVPPGLAVAEGDEEALVRFDGAVAEDRARSAAACRLVEPGDDPGVPLLRGMPFGSFTGVLVPIRVDVAPEVALDRATAFARVGYDARGRSLVARWAREVLEVEEAVLHAEPPSPRAVEPAAVAMDVRRGASHRRRIALRVTTGAGDGWIGLEAEAW